MFRAINYVRVGMNLSRFGSNRILSANAYINSHSMRFMSDKTKIPKIPEIKDIESHTPFSEVMSVKSQEIYEQIRKSQVKKDFTELVNEMEKRKYNTRIIGAFIGAAGLFFSYSTIKDWFTDQAADFSKDYFENEKFQKSFLVFLENTISDVTKSEKVKKDVNYLVIETTKDPHVQSALVDMFKNVLYDKQIINSTSDLSNDVVNNIMTSEDYRETREELVNYAVTEIFNILANPKIHLETGNAIRKSIWTQIWW